jgi:hypothetical protein
LSNSGSADVEGLPANPPAPTRGKREEASWRGLVPRHQIRAGCRARRRGRSWAGCMLEVRSSAIAPEGVGVSRGDHRVEARGARGRGVRPHAAAGGPPNRRCGRQLVEARERLGGVFEVEVLEARHETIASESLSAGVSSRRPRRRAVPRFVQREERVGS